MESIIKESQERTLLRLLYWRERSLLEPTLDRTRHKRFEALLKRAVARKNSGTALGRNVFEKLVLFVTRACQMRCGYCPVSKEGGHMPIAVLRRGVELLMSSEQQDLQLHFFGGEPLLKFDLVQEAVRLAETLKIRRKKRLNYLITTNGLALSDRVADFFKKHDFTVALSCDGDAKTFGAQRPGARGKNFFNEVKAALERLRKSEVSYHITIVVSPSTVSRLAADVRHLADLGHRDIEITYEVGCFWHPRAVRQLLASMGNLSKESQKSGRFRLTNLTEDRFEPAVVNSELALDVDGNLYRHVGIVLAEGFKMPRKDFLLGSVKTARSIDDYVLSPFDDLLLLVQSYSKHNTALRPIILNNMEVGWTVERFLRPNLHPSALNARP